MNDGIAAGGMGMGTGLGMGSGGSEPGSGHSTEVCVPLAALALPGEGEALENPEPGDPVQFQAEGKVSRIDGDKAYVELSAVNGEPVTKAPAGEEYDMNAERSALGALAGGGL